MFDDLERENKLDDMIWWVTEVFMLSLGSMWISFSYYLFLYQQRLDVARIPSSQGDSFLMFVLFIPFVRLGTPSKNKNYADVFEQEDWRIFPRRIVWLLLAAALSAAILYWNPKTGQMLEKDVLQVFWSTLIIGLTVLSLVQRLLLLILFRFKHYDTVSTGPGSTLFTVLSILGLTSGLLSIIVFGFIPFWKLPNFIY